jgi:hypothetical protein
MGKLLDKSYFRWLAAVRDLFTGTTPDPNPTPSRLLAAYCLGYTPPQPSPYAVIETETGAFYPTVQVDTMRYRLRKSIYGRGYFLDTPQHRKDIYELVECYTLEAAEDVLQDYINQQPKPVKIVKIHEYRTTDPR